MKNNEASLKPNHLSSLCHFFLKGIGAMAIWTLSTISVAAQKSRDWGRYSDEPKPPLPDINWESVGLGAILVVVGFIWARLTMWNPNNEGKEYGFFAVNGPLVVMGIGVIMLFPLLVWGFTILQGGVAIVGFIILTLVVLIGIFSLFKR